MGMTWWETIVAPTWEEMDAKRRINKLPCNFIPQSQGCYQDCNHQIVCHCQRQTELLWEIMLQDLQDRSNDPHKANHVFQYASLDFKQALGISSVSFKKFRMICTQIYSMSGKKLQDIVASAFWLLHRVVQHSCLPKAYFLHEVHWMEYMGIPQRTGMPPGTGKHFGNC